SLNRWTGTIRFQPLSTPPTGIRAISACAIASISLIASKRFRALRSSGPTLYQTYDRGFSFALFSPRDYIETGPALDWPRRWRRHYSLSLYARLGEQNEFQASWKKLGTFRAEAERELYKAWGVRLDAFWSSSDLARPTGFRR